MNSFWTTIFGGIIAMLGYTIHGSIFWSIVDFIFFPVALVKWLIYHELTISVIQQTFSFLWN